MKQLLFLIGALAILSACRKAQKLVRVPESANFKKADSLWSLQKNDSAFYYFDQATTSSKDSLEIAMSYNFMASIQTDAGDYFGAQESLTASLKYLNEHKKQDRYCLASDYNELGMTSSKLRDFDGAIPYFDLAVKFSDDPNYKRIFINNKANAYRRKGAYPQALTLYRQVLKYTKSNEKEYARLLTNMAFTKWLYHKDYRAAPELHQALQIRERLDDRWGQNSSYAHLADYYTDVKADSALFYAKAMYTVSRQLSSPDDQLEALQKLIKLGNAADARQYFNRYEQLNDSLLTVRNAAKNQFALIRYHTEKHKADNLRLKQQNTEKEHKIFQQRVFLALGAVLLLSVVFWFKNRRQRLQLEADNRVRQDRLQVSQRVHDVVANGIYRVMNEVDYNEKVDKNYLLGQLEYVYEQSRKISHNEEPESDEEFSEKLNHLVNAFKSDSIKVALSGNQPELWKKVSDTIKGQLEPLLQELMVNMSKHSFASQALIDFEFHSDRLLVSYRDNGVGFPADIRNGNGLQNTENRIKSLGGEVTFGAKDEPGASLQFSIPIN